MRKENIILITYFIVIIFLLVSAVIIFFIAFQKRKNKLLIEQFEAKQNYELELSNSRLEIQEQTFKNIAWELHDNVGQLLSVAGLQLNMLENSIPSEYQLQVGETKKVVSETLQAVRSLSKILNNDVILSNGLVTSLEIEIERFNRLKFLEAELIVEGEEVVFNSENEILIFRILQEFLSNVMKHAKASKLFVTLVYEENALLIKAIDDGVGFDMNKKTNSSGMKTMRGRADLLHADFYIKSQPKDGTELYLKCSYNHGY